MSAAPNATPAWGSFNAPRMLAHVTDALRMATGDLPVAPRGGPLAFWPINSLVMFYLPWPKSAPTAPGRPQSVANDDRRARKDRHCCDVAWLSTIARTLGSSSSYFICPG